MAASLGSCRHGRPTPGGDGVGRGDLRRLHRPGHRVEYPFPAKTDLVDTHHAQEQVRKTHRALTQADRVLLVGAGPVGIELAGEIREAWPEKSIALLDVADEILGGPYMPELKAELRRQLVEPRVELIMGSPLQQAPPTEPGSWPRSPSPPTQELT